MVTGWTFLEPEKNGAKPVSASGTAIILQKIAMPAGSTRQSRHALGNKRGSDLFVQVISYPPGPSLGVRSS